MLGSTKMNAPPEAEQHQHKNISWINVQNDLNSTEIKKKSS